MLLDFVRASLKLGAAFSFTHGDSPVSFMCTEHDNQSLPVMWAGLFRQVLLSLEALRGPVTGGTLAVNYVILLAQLNIAGIYILNLKTKKKLTSVSGCKDS